ncbi:hypothetical protein KV100_19110 [Mumia sp. zg.B21]|uniref:hypothetical protein n=1 Tax=Mumia sp. zg.B21 TaxID=2855447 RepID=UPI001C6EF03F|nr:hypothetical protein [Mumia sp. zg.B21]MBW9211764.1 hypothetical protein [Mumia sp. zg.B21]
MANEDEDYDPMVYDVMCELATHLGGIYISRARAAATPEDEARWRQADRDLMEEVDAVPPMELDAVNSMTTTLRERLKAANESAP